MEKRKQTFFKGTEKPVKGSVLPVDYLKLVEQTFATHFAEGLKALSKIRPQAGFRGSGVIYPDEILLCLAVIFGKELSATSVYASVDFDPKANQPTAEQLLGVCVDALASFFQKYLDPKEKEWIEAFADSSLGSFEEIPFEWTAVEIEKRQVFLRVDKGNPEIEELTDSWLEKNDPELKDQQIKDDEKAESRFLLGPKKKKN